MAEETPAPVPPSPPSPPASVPIPFKIGEEFGTARKNLPPAKIVLLAIAAVLLVTLIVALVQHQQPAHGTIEGATAVAVPGQTQVLAAVTISLHNSGTKPYVIRAIRADLTAGGNFNDDAAPSVDLERYLQAFPALREHAHNPLKVDTAIAPAGDLLGTAIFSFPVTEQAFNSRSSLTISITADGQPDPLVLGK